MLTRKDITLYVVVIVLGFVGMGVWRFSETIWNDHNLIKENTAQIEMNRTNVQAVINYLNQQAGGAIQQLAPAVPAEAEPEPDPSSP